MFKTRPAQIKAAGEDDGLEEGQFRALVSVFGNVDSYGDRVMPGAFSKTLAEWAELGDPIPIYWSHQMADPDMNIGYVVSAEETENGLEVLGQLDVGEGSPKAAQARMLMQKRRVSQFSFAYDVLDQEEVDGVNELRELKLYEVGPTPIGANDQTELLAVKATALPSFSSSITNTAGPLVLNPSDYVQLGLKVGRTISAKNESTLRDAATSLEAAAKAIKSVLASLDSGSPDDAGKANTQPSTASAGPAKDEEPSPAKSEEPGRRSAASWEAHINLSELEGARHA
jgi:HK97 family phage prohead protease